MLNELNRGADMVRLGFKINRQVEVVHIRDDQGFRTRMDSFSLVEFFVEGQDYPLFVNTYNSLPFDNKVRASYRILYDFAGAIRRLSNEDATGALRQIPNTDHRRLVRKYIDAFSDPVAGFGIMPIPRIVLKKWNIPLSGTYIPGDPLSELVLTDNTDLIERYITTDRRPNQAT
jgi:hypothetical protein